MAFKSYISRHEVLSVSLQMPPTDNTVGRMIQAEVFTVAWVKFQQLTTVQQCVVAARLAN